MFKSKQTKQKTVNSVNDLLSNYLLISDKQLIPTTSSKKIDKYMTSVVGNKKLGSGASRINKLVKESNKLNDNIIINKKKKMNERKLRNKEIKKNLELQLKVEKLSKLENKDKAAIDKLINENLSSLEQFESNDDNSKSSKELLDIQKEILKLTDYNKRSIRKEKNLSAKKRRQMEFDAKVKKGTISVPGLTPGLAPIGDSDNESDESEDYSDNGLSGFKDDFDDYN